MAFPPNRGVPLAFKITQEGDGWLIPHDSGDGPIADPARLLDTIAAPPNLNSARIDVFAVDITPSDEFPEKDLLYVTASFTDSHGQRIDLRSTGVARGEGRQRFGGVGSNLYSLEQDRWTFRPLQGWATFDVRVNGWLTDSGLLGEIAVTHPIDDAHEQPKLSLAIFGRTEAAGMPDQRPLSYAPAGQGALETSGWTIVWDDVAYRQAPVLSVRAERGDTLATIAKEMSVDHELLSMANAEYRTGRTALRPGDLVLVPLLVRAATPAAKKTHKSVALSWHEIMHGWTTLN